MLERFDQAIQRGDDSPDNCKPEPPIANFVTLTLSAPLGRLHVGLGGFCLNRFLVIRFQLLSVNGAKSAH
jgi:hypothetical protein